MINSLALTKMTLVKFRFLRVTLPAKASFFIEAAEVLKCCFGIRVFGGSLWKQ